MRILESIKRFNDIKRFRKLLKIRSLEMEYDRLTKCLEMSAPHDEFAILVRRRKVKETLHEAQKNYSALLPVGEREVFRVA